MVPPGVRKFFFSVTGSQYCAQDLDQIPHDKQSFKIEQENSPSKQSKPGAEGKATNSDSKESLTLINIDNINFIDVKRRVVNNSDPYDPAWIEKLRAKPRITKSLRDKDGVKTPWDFKKSVFRTYTLETDEQNARCFENDWSFIVA